MTSLPPSRFSATRWTRVIAARGRDAEGQRALSELCADYYAPVLAFVRQSAGDMETARDLTHDFFAKVLERPALDGAEPGRGRFRSYLLGAVKHFLRDEWKRRQAARRGSGEIALSLDEASGLSDESPAAETADAVFDREWAISLVGRSLDRLETECREQSRGSLYAILKPWLTGNIAASQSEAAVQLGVSEGAVKVAIHRLRKRYRELVMEELSQTLIDGEDPGLEMQHLIRALGTATRAQS